MRNKTKANHGICEENEEIIHTRRVWPIMIAMNDTGCVTDLVEIDNNILVIDKIKITQKVVYKKILALGARDN
jgi:hypothetical protein